MATKVIFLLSGTSWTVPSDWNSADNSIECIGGGGGGRSGPAANQGGSGGGGGAYSKIVNLALTPAAAVSIAIGSGGGSNTDGGDTWFNGTALNNASVSAEGGKTGAATTTGGLGGLTANGIGTTKFAGGNGGDRVVTGTSTGGGGAAGPTGAGGNAGGTNNQTGGDGSDGAGGTGGLASVGNNGNQYTSTEDSTTAGAGGGGGGRTNNGVGFTGGLYGAGGGGGRGNNQSGGSGRDGIIVITYTPIVAKSYSFASIF